MKAKADARTKEQDAALIFDRNLAALIRFASQALQADASPGGPWASIYWHLTDASST